MCWPCVWDDDLRALENTSTQRCAPVYRNNMTLMLRLSSLIGVLTFVSQVSDIFGFTQPASNFGCEVGNRSRSRFRSRAVTSLDARRRRRKARDDSDEDDDYYIADADDYYDEVDDLGYDRRGEGLKVPSPFGRKSGYAFCCYCSV